MKKKHKHQDDAFYQQLMKMKPLQNEENFWVFSLVVDDANYPTWEQRFSFVGTYEQNVKTCVEMTHTLAESGFPESGIQIESYQGDAGRRYLATSIEQEKAYQAERQGMPQN
jgi:hypothetical protein